MKKIKYLIFFLSINTINKEIKARDISPENIAGRPSFVWQTFDEIKDTIDNKVEKYDKLEAVLRAETERELKKCELDAAKVAETNKSQAAVMYAQIKNFRDQAERNEAEIIAKSKKMKYLSDYIHDSYVELKEIKRKHLQFP